MFSIPWPSRSASLATFVTEPLLRRVRRWARKRQGRDALTTRIAAGRTYILPTGVGLIYALMTFAMLLGSMNYNNNLSFVLTFLLVGVGFVAMHQCQRNLVNLEISFAGVEPVFTGSVAEFRFAILNRSKSTRYRIALNHGNEHSALADLPPGESRLFVLPLAAPRRGRIRMQAFGIRSLFPFELFRSWAWLHMDIHGLVYPPLATDAPQSPPSELSLGHRQHDARGEEDFAGLRRFIVGDSPRNVAWKAYARSGQLLSKQFAGADMSSQWFDFDSIPDRDVETRLAILTRWVCDADRTREDYGLRMPGHNISPSHGSAHRSRCLEALALFGIDDA
jgi:uncharacterized protein (DUF58 family)